jgi:hypothetical protein
MIFMHWFNLHLPIASFISIECLTRRIVARTTSKASKMAEGMDAYMKNIGLGPSASKQKFVFRR